MSDETVTNRDRTSQNKKPQLWRMVRIATDTLKVFSLGVIACSIVLVICLAGFRAIEHMGFWFMPLFGGVVLFGLALVNAIEKDAQRQREVENEEQEDDE